MILSAVGKGLRKFFFQTVISFVLSIKIMNICNDDVLRLGGRGRPLLPSTPQVLEKVGENDNLSKLCPNLVKN